MAGGQRRADGAVGTVGSLLAQLRLARGLSQVGLAAELCAAAREATVTRNEVSRWERGERLPGRFWLAWLSVVLETPLERLEQAVEVSRAARRARPDRADPGGRVDLWRPPSASQLLAALDQADAWDLPELAHDWLAGPAGAPEPVPVFGSCEPVPGTGTGTGSDELRRLESRLRDLRRQDDLVGGIDHAGRLGRELRGAIRVRRAVGSGRLRDRALRVVAGYAQLAGWALVDAGKDRAAGRAYRVALLAAGAGRDRLLAAHVLGALSHQRLAAGDPHQALLLARTGYAGIQADGTPLTHALLLHRIALANARLGEHRAASLALAAADRAAGRADPALEPDWLYWLDQRELQAMTGRCQAALGRHLRASRLLAGPHRPGVGHRTAALYGICLARTYLVLGELEQAYRAAVRALRDTVASGSARAAAELRRLHPMMLRHRDHLPAMRVYVMKAVDASPCLPGGGLAAGRASVDR